MLLKLELLQKNIAKIKVVRATLLHRVTNGKAILVRKNRVKLIFKLKVECKPQIFKFLNAKSKIQITYEMEIKKYSRFLT